MGRVLDLALAISLIFMIIIMQFTVANTLTPVKNEMLDQLEDGNANTAEDKRNLVNQYETAVKWVPNIAVLGVIIVVIFREFRRQRVTRGGRIR